MRKQLDSIYGHQSARRRRFSPLVPIGVLASVVLALIAGTAFVLPQLRSYAAANGSVSYYVSPSGNDNNDGSQAHPFATINKAASVATPGTTVHVLPGTYTSTVDTETSGTATAHITYISDTRWAAQIRTNGADTVWYNAGNYVDIIGFDISDPNGRRGIHDYGSYVRFMQNRIHHLDSYACPDGGAGIDFGDYTQHDIDIAGNIVHDIGPPFTCWIDHGIYISENLNERVYNNISYNNSGYGIHCWHACSNVVVVNNLVFGNRWGGIVLGDGDAGAGILNNSVVANNISYNNSRYGISEYEYFGQRTIGSNNQFLNNLVYGNSSGGFSLLEGNIDQNTVTADPQFVNFQPDGTGDYHLSPTSPAIDAGTSLDAPSTDFDGSSRPQGAGYDIGAYEFGLSFEAEAGTITAPFQVITGTPTYISQTVNAASPSQGGLATYTFSVPTAGDYVINAVVNAPDTNTNSFYVNIDTDPANDTNAEPYEVWDILPYTVGFEQRTVSWRGNGTFDADQFVPKVFTLSAGTHTLYIRGREPNTQLDNIAIVAYTGITGAPTPTIIPSPTPTSFIDTVPPTVAITNPANGSTVKRGRVLIITATSSDDVGVTRVEFYVNGSLLCTDTVAPYACNWNVPGKANVFYTLEAKAYDAAGNTGITKVRVKSSG